MQNPNPQLEPSTLRHVMGHYPSGVVIVTAQTPDGPVGMTLQSFHSLSLDPPMVALFPAKSSSTWPQIAQADYIGISILADAQHHLAGQFARSAESRFDGVAWEADPQGAPRLEGAQAYISARIGQVYDGGDHHIVTADIAALAADDGAQPLVFYKGRFHGLKAS